MIEDKQFYAICFDNDPDFPGVVQWVNVGCEWHPANINQDLQIVRDAFESASSQYPEIEYKMVVINLVEIES